mmetsp:Transcript_27580/g.84627  ORF Transcript_27580/g.84627 Transcript_27580/m.84627 type:complete len:85 (-) Transcript_27580:880-1134(-)
MEKAAFLHGPRRPGTRDRDDPEKAPTSTAVRDETSTYVIANLSTPPMATRDVDEGKETAQEPKKERSRTTGRRREWFLDEGFLH